MGKIDRGEKRGKSYRVIEKTKETEEEACSVNKLSPCVCLILSPPSCVSPLDDATRSGGMRGQNRGRRRDAGEKLRIAWRCGARGNEGKEGRET